MRYRREVKDYSEPRFNPAFAFLLPVSKDIQSLKVSGSAVETPDGLLIVDRKKGYFEHFFTIQGFHKVSTMLGLPQVR